MAHKQQQDFFTSVKNKFPHLFNNIKVLDIGSLDINGNNRHLFENSEYIGLDLDEGPNVDVVCKAHIYKPDFKFNVVISGECFEHDIFYDKTILNMVELLEDNGIMIFSCASTGRPEHGTIKTSPENAPFLLKFGEEWGNYYKNIDELDVRKVIDVDSIFSNYEFIYQEETCDLYFWGIKKKCETSILVVNLNNLEYTKNCIEDLKKQDYPFNLTVIDQNSYELDTKSYFLLLNSGINLRKFNFIQNNENIPLNHLWNDFVKNSNTKYICLLNNDVRLSPNFISSAIKVLEKESNVGFVNHVSNNKDYMEWSDILNYKIIETPYRQGWDLFFRKECYSTIPNGLEFFYGDDYLYSKLYSSNMKGAYILNSPMIHYERSTTIEKGGRRDCSFDNYFFNLIDLEYKNLSFVEELSKWKPEFEKIVERVYKSKRVYITHITEDYLEVALNLAKSIRIFSDIPLIIYCVNFNGDFIKLENVFIRNIELDLKERVENDYVYSDSGNFYINRDSERIFKILSAKTIAMEMALEEGWDEVCYLDSDCLATPIVDELFDWCDIIDDYPIATEGIHEYMVNIINGVQFGNPFEHTWPYPDNKLSLEWPLMNFLELNENQRGRYRTTGIMLMNQKCLQFIKTWKELCYILPKLVNLRRYAPYHEETIYNVLSWKKTNKGFPLCYVNLGEGIETVKHLYSSESKEGYLRWDDNDTSKNFYKIPDDKKYIKVLHGEKRKLEADIIIEYLNKIIKNNA